MTATTTDTAPSASSPDHLAFDRTAPLRSAVSTGEAAHYSLDAFHAAGKALWIAPRVRPYRDRMLALSEFDVAQLDGLEDLARALRFVQTEILRRTERQKQIQALAAEGWRLRAQMMSYAEALSYKDQFSLALIVRLRQGSGYRALVENLTVLVHELLELPANKIGPDAPVTRAELDRASELAHEINVYVGNAADVDRVQAALLLERRKLGLLLLRAHDEIRRAITYLRWRDGDAADLVPSLYVIGKGRKAAERAAEPPQNVAAVHDPLPSPTAPPSSAERHSGMTETSLSPMVAGSVGVPVEEH